jgi:RNA polymerase sigma-70 factor (family 1)
MARFNLRSILSSLTGILQTVNNPKESGKPYRLLNKIVLTFDTELIFANLHKLIEAFAWSLVLKRRKFQVPQDDKQGLTFRRGLPYSWYGLRRPQYGKRRPAPLYFITAKDTCIQDFQRLLRKLPNMEQRPLTDAQATTLLRAGREEGLKHFFHQYDTALSYFALRMIEDEAAAEDIVADAFVKLWERCTQIAPHSSIKAYLYSMVRNASIDYLRRKKREKLHLKEVVYLQPISEPDLYALEIEAKIHHNLYEAIKDLPPRMGQVFRMFYFQRKPLAQIAAELQVSVNTVRNQKTQALLFLRKSVMVVAFVLFSFL